MLTRHRAGTPTVHRASTGPGWKEPLPCCGRYQPDGLATTVTHDPAEVTCRPEAESRSVAWIPAVQAALLVLALLVLAVGLGLYRHDDCTHRGGVLAKVDSRIECTWPATPIPPSQP